MYQTLKNRLKQIEEKGFAPLLKNSLTGLEKESLRVDSEGHISQEPHPKVLGSALKNAWVTTDYAEALLELITPPCERAHKSLDFLLDVETFVYKKLKDELLWTTSMPCVIRGEEDITIANYGTSNAGKMKSIYRQGLAERYGKMMQVIAGIHFNYSVPVDFWPAFQKLEGEQDKSSQDFISERYMGMTRNIQRYGWLIPYLFGTSPAICKSFLSGMSKPETMKVFNEFTCYEPFGTSLRMGDIGYTNRKEDKRGIKANYNSLEQYIDSLRCAINTPHEKYENIGLKDGDTYLQLNTNILQIENEYYSSVRPKQILQGFEKPTDALEQRGIQYVELRSVDINAFHPAGLTHKQLYFLELFMLFCLLQDSPEITPDEAKEIDKNQSLVAHQGRKPNLALKQNGDAITLTSWANQLFDEMLGVAKILNSVHSETCYIRALESQRELLLFPDKTPSAKVLSDIMNRDGSYYQFAKRKSEEHRDYFLTRSLDPEYKKRMELMASESLKQQAQLEADDTLDFDTFLQHYFDNKL
ncbi:MAG: glutamate--cysteine ligase [Cocleimonas sp.]